MELSKRKKYEFQTERGSKVEVEIEAKMKDLSKNDLEDVLHEFMVRIRNFYLDLGREIAGEN